MAEDAERPYKSSGLRVCVVGTGRIGLTAGGYLAHLGHRVVCAGSSVERVPQFRTGTEPLVEDGLPELVDQMVALGRLAFSIDGAEAVADADVVLLCPPTPQAEDSSTDLRRLLAVAREISSYIRAGAVVVGLSDVPDGVAGLVAEALGRDDVTVAANAEFLAAGTAVRDFLHTGRTVIDSDPAGSSQLIAEPFHNDDTYLTLTGAASVETIRGRAATQVAAHSTNSGTGPKVSVVIPTRDRPLLVRRAIASVVDQEYAGMLEVIVVFDGAAPDTDLESQTPGRLVRTMVNARTPGLAGGRNTGIVAASGELVAFCDDDDVWLPGKLRAQIDLMRERPDAELLTTAMVVDFRGKRSIRLAGCSSVSYTDLLQSRMAMLHSSSFLIRRSALLDGLGLVEESLPRSMAEDWELLLRAARRSPIAHVDKPLVEITWGGNSYFAEQWAVRNEAQLWLMEHYPDMLGERRAAGLCYGKLAFGAAAQGHRRDAVRWATRALRANWRERRVLLTLFVVVGAVRWETIVQTLNRRGHGI